MMLLAAIVSGLAAPRLGRSESPLRQPNTFGFERPLAPSSRAREYLIQLSILPSDQDFLKIAVQDYQAASGSRRTLYNCIAAGGNLRFGRNGVWDRTYSKLDSEVGALGLPGKAHFGGNEQEFMVDLALAGLIPTRPLRVGQGFSFSWRSDAHDFSAHGYGRLGSIDAARRTATMDWRIVLEPQGFPKPWLMEQVRSVYSTDDATLLGSKGRFLTGSGDLIPLRIERIES